MILTKQVVLTLLIQIKISTSLYTKKVDQSHPSHHLYANSKKQKSALNFCTDDRGHVTDCELLEIIGVSAVVEEYEGVYDVNNSKNYEVTTQSLLTEYEDMKKDTGENNLTENQKSSVSWKDQPKRGMCYDGVQAYTFDCNLIEVLE